MADLFLKIDGILGESLDDKHRNEIEIAAFSWGATNVVDVATGGAAAAGKVSMQDFHVSMQMSKASPALFLSCATGKRLKEATLTARRAGKDQQEFLKVKMTDLIVTSYMSQGADGGDAPMETVSFNFGRMDIEYRAIKPDGSLDAPVTASWDVKNIKAMSKGKSKRL